MELKLLRYSSDSESTGGLLFVDDRFFCFVCEDEYRQEKVSGETRIPAGNYVIKLRNEGGMTKRYLAKFPGLHRGMLWLQNVPGFEWIYIHIGNTAEHTEGCLLVGYGASRDRSENKITNSTSAYKDLYGMVVFAMDRGEDVEIEIREM